jgi:protein gp37
MGKNSAIEWTTHTFNPWVGCAHVSPGCANCYAETLIDTRFGRVQWGVNGTRSRTSDGYWRQPVKWNAEAERTGVPRSVFCGSLCDWLEDRVDCQRWRYDLFELIEATRNLRWLMLTKRPEEAGRAIYAAGYTSMFEFFEHNPHVWFGVSVENQQQADKRIPLLLDIPARVRFLSMEPLLGPVRFAVDDFSNRGHGRGWLGASANGESGVSWVIVGGESGPNARPMHPDWARSIRDHCQAAGVPFFFKQWGEWHSDYPMADVLSGKRDGCTWTAWDDGEQMWRVGKRAAGRLLDGREWLEFPATVHP